MMQEKKSKFNLFYLFISKLGCTFCKKFLKNLTPLIHFNLSLLASVEQIICRTSSLAASVRSENENEKGLLMMTYLVL